MCRKHCFSITLKRIYKSSTGEKVPVNRLYFTGLEKTQGLRVYQFFELFFSAQISDLHTLYINTWIH